MNGVLADSRQRGTVVDLDRTLDKRLVYGSGAKLGIGQADHQ